MTKELREPPLLSDEEIRQVYNRLKMRPPKWIPEIDRVVVRVQLEADIKWMKEHCYLKAERELPECPYEKIMITTDGFAQEIISYRNAQQDMLKKVDGVAYRACKEFKD